MKQSFNFEDAGRAFACRIEAARKSGTAAWWWFTVSNDSHRYAAFYPDASDTEDSVRARIVAFYDNRLARLAAPREPWRRPENPATRPSTVADPNGPAALATEPSQPAPPTDGPPS